jgi:Histidine phosphatase superfamily (branch 2)
MESNHRNDTTASTCTTGKALIQQRFTRPCIGFPRHKRLFILFQCIMISCIVIRLHRVFTTRPYLLSSVASQECVTNLPRSASSYQGNNGHCRSKSTSSSDSSSTGSTGSNQRKTKPKNRQEEYIDVTAKSPTKLYRRAVHVIHRHGDRTPITPLKDEAFWASQLISNDTLSKIATYTQLIEPENAQNTHNANGRGPFGKLTALGLQQMMDLGSKLRTELAGNNDPIVDTKGRTFHPHIFTPQFDPVHPLSIRVRSTNFIRTIQSVQGLLHGLIPVENYRFYTGNNASKNIATIDIRHTNWMIPDPQPRRTKEQAVLEIELSQQEHLMEKEKEFLPFAIAMTKALQPLLADDARDADFGVPQQELTTNHQSTDIKPLSWNQLAEITKCLAVRDMLPDGITKDDQERISQHAAYRWYESFRHPLLAYYAMNTFTQTIVSSLLKHNPEEDAIDDEPVMNIWSAHDSSKFFCGCIMLCFCTFDLIKFNIFGTNT